MIEKRPPSKDSVTSSEKFKLEFLRSNSRRMTTRHTPRFSQRLTTSWMRQPPRSFPSKRDSRKDSRTSKVEKVTSRRNQTPKTRESIETSPEFQERAMMSTTLNRTAYSPKISSSNEKSWPINRSFDCILTYIYKRDLNFRIPPFKSLIDLLSVLLIRASEKRLEHSIHELFCPITMLQENMKYLQR